MEALIGSIYESTVAGSGFVLFLSHLAAHFRLRSAQLIVRNLHSHAIRGAWSSHTDAEWIQRYADDYGREDRLAHVMMTSPSGRFYASNRDIPDIDSFLKHSRFAREYLAPQGIAHAAAATIHVEGSWHTQLFIQRRHDPGGFSDAELAELDRLLPHLQRAVLIHQRLLESRFDALAMHGALDAFATPVLMLNQLGKVMVANQAAQAVLARGAPGISLEAGNLLIEAPDSERQLSTYLRLGESVHADTASPRTLRIQRGAGLSPLTLVVTTVRLTQHDGDGIDASLVFLFDPDLRAAPDPAMLAMLFGLSEAEAALTVGLCKGESLETLAETRNVTLNTLRTQLKSVFNKTGTRRQAELVARVMGSPAYAAR
ncbi:helix-turn-helix transcriptional regulator [Chitiniphilus shinanonensis]|uniref:helix-turn-helix transcriptional regulator n=1 Tax=Chitiniphilus shinanonensis TaxID=553088 RepID=UPI003037AE37